MSNYLHKVQFGIYDADPEEITRKLGIAPDKTTIKGEPKPIGSNQTMVAKNNSWLLELSDNDKDGEYEVLLTEMLKKLEPLETEITELAAQYHVEIAFLGYATHTHAAGIHLDKTTLHKLAKLSIELDIDIYYIGGEDDDEWEEHSVTT